MARNFLASTSGHDRREHAFSEDLEGTYVGFNSIRHFEGQAKGTTLAKLNAGKTSV